MLQDILYVESMKDYVKVFTVKGMISTKQSITPVEVMLPEKNLCGYIVLSLFPFPK